VLVIIIMFFVIALACVALGYFLQRKNFNLAFVSIGSFYILNEVLYLEYFPN
jgi:hypothetical protein